MHKGFNRKLFDSRSLPGDRRRMSQWVVALKWREMEIRISYLYFLKHCQCGNRIEVATHHNTLQQLQTHEVKKNAQRAEQSVWLANEYPKKVNWSSMARTAVAEEQTDFPKHWWKERWINQRSKWMQVIKTNKCTSKKRKADYIVKSRNNFEPK